MPAATRQYTLLAVLFIVACVVQTGNAVSLLHTLLHSDEVPDPPFTLVPATRTIASGPLRDNQILAMEGRPFHAAEQLAEAAIARRPGDTLRLTLSEPGGRATEQIIKIPSYRAVFGGLRDITSAVATDLLIPLLSLGLGFAAVLLRPRDGNAWLALFVILGFTETLRRRFWPGPLSDLTRIWNAVWTAAWPVSMALFGIYFPTRSPRDKRRPPTGLVFGWMKYAGLSVVAAVGFACRAIELVWQHDINAAQALRTAYVRLNFSRIAITILTTAGLLVIFRLKSAATSAADARRRLKLLQTGLLIGLGPVLLLALYAVFSGDDIFRNVPWPFTVSALLLLNVFPLTLAYVIIVERAADLRFVIREGVRYGIARAGWIDRRFFREACHSEMVLAGLASEAGRYLEIPPLIERLALTIGEALHITEIVILLPEGGVFKTAYSTRPGQPMDIPAAGRIAAKLEKGREPLEIDFDQPPLWLRSLAADELQTLDFMRTRLLLPIPGREGLAGIISLGPKHSGAPHSNTEIRLLRAVARQAGMALGSM